VSHVWNTQPGIDWQEAAQKKWRYAILIAGDGPYAITSACGGEFTVTLWPSWEEAVKALAALKEIGCNDGACIPGLHRLVVLRP
jgi:hypothetical protein